MPVRVLLRAGLALAIAGVSAAHATNGYLSHGYGIKSKGAAGVGAALPQDTLTIATNPAGLIEAGHRSDMGVELFVPDRGGEIKGNAYGPDESFDGNGTEYFLIPELGHSHLVCDDLALGFAMYGNGGMNTDYDRNPYAFVPEFEPINGCCGKLGGLVGKQPHAHRRARGPAANIEGGRVELRRIVL